MASTDRYFIDLCKHQIEEKLHLGNGSRKLRQRDMEYLVDLIEQKSGSSLSLSTLKRLWKEDFNQTPHPNTLNALASLLDHKDWQEFKQAHMPPENGNAASKTTARKRQPLIVWVLMGMVILLVVLKVMRDDKPQPPGTPVVEGPVVFEANKTVALGVPNTVIFHYDVSHIQADSFFIQQSWNPQNRVRIDPSGEYFSSIYYFPGFHRARLFANDSMIRMERIHLKTNGWEPSVIYTYEQQIPLYLKNPINTGGALTVHPDSLTAANVNTDQPFMLNYRNIRDFDDVESDNFTLETRLRCERKPAMACPELEVRIHCEEHIFFVPLTTKGCVSNLSLKVGEVFLPGQENDLSAFGRDVYTWQTLKWDVRDKYARIYLDEELVYETAFQEDFGKIVGLTCRFTGLGSVDLVRLANGTGKVVYEEHFE